MPPPDQQTRSALVVDDEPQIVELIALLLGERGWRVESARSVASARKTLERMPVLDLAVVDVRLPDGSGLDLAAIAKSAHPDADVVVVTGFPSYEAVVEAVRVGIVDYVSKPFSADDIRAMVNRAEARFTIRRGDLADPHTRRMLSLLDGILQRLMALERHMTTLVERTLGPTGSTTGAH